MRIEKRGGSQREAHILSQTHIHNKRPSFGTAAVICLKWAARSYCNGIGDITVTVLTQERIRRMVCGCWKNVIGLKARPAFPAPYAMPSIFGLRTVCVRVCVCYLPSRHSGNTESYSNRFWRNIPQINMSPYWPYLSHFLNRQLPLQSIWSYLKSPLRVCCCLSACVVIFSLSRSIQFKGFIGVP